MEIPKQITTALMNETLRDDELRAILSKLESDKDKERFGLVCKRWLHLQSTDRKKLCVRAGPAMLKKMALRFSRVLELDLSHSVNRGFYPGITDSDLGVIAKGFSGLRVLNLQDSPVQYPKLMDGSPNTATIRQCLAAMIIDLKVELSDLNSNSLKMGVSFKNISPHPRTISRDLYLPNVFFPNEVGFDPFDPNIVLVGGNSEGITDVGMISVANGLSGLQALDASHCKNKKLTEKGLAVIAKGCCNLRTLHLAGCRFISDGLLQNLSNSCPKLEELGLQGCIKITDSGLTSLVTGCRRIKYLDVSKCGNIGDTGVSSVSNICSSHLRTLKLLDCYKVGNESILTLSKSCKNLETLVIGGCRDISDGPLTLLVNSCHESLKCLRMDWCLNISDSALSCIFSQCRNLEALDIGCCEEVTDSPFQVFGSGDFESSLKVLRVINCPKITLVGISMLLRSCNKLEYLDLRSCPHITKVGCDEAGLQFPESCKVKFMESLVELDGQADAFF
ncbi:hypothetical protein GIB67_020811 [Kingdonia uniflora]|uniref:F-box/LRR-repeat protein 15-like leucin rich repeat domain-containing protein n=1 Tax=Kingdonia uniflora TaxID=39325 RepID=A0A7J7M7K0_9MAGN|nr:hypothetical protein GIB67_020811 [Kingdonia uniflora]